MKYRVRRYWQLCDKVEVEADSVDGAIERAHDLPLDNPRANYVLGSLESDSCDDVMVISERGET